MTLEKKAITHYQIFNRALEAEEKGDKIYHLEVGDPDIEVDPEVIDEMCRRAREGYTHYSSPRGILELRKMITTYLNNRLGVERDPEDILVTIGSKTGLYLVLKYLVKPRESIVLLEPTWGAYRTLITQMEINYIPIKTHFNNTWMPTTKDLDNIRKMDFKAFLLLNPSNPTGKVLPRKIIDEIVDIVIEKNAFLIGDEVYFDTIFKGPKDYPSTLKYEYKKTVALYSLSKSHAMTGFRLGWVVSEEDILEKLKKGIQHVYTNVPVFIQYAGIKALSKTEIVEKNREIYRRRVEIMANALSKMGFKFHYPDATFYIFSMVPDGVGDVNKFALELLDEKGVAVAPGASFGGYNNFIRFSASAKEEDIKIAMERIMDYINENSKTI